METGRPGDHGLDHPFLRNFNHRTFHDFEAWFDVIRQVVPSGEADPQRPLF